MVTRTASKGDVKGVIDTSVSDDDIEGFLDDAAFEADQAISNYSSSQTTEEKKQLEKYLAALLIRSHKEKGISSQSGPSRNQSYEDTWTVGELRAAVSRRDPSDSLASRVVRNTSRYSGTVTRE